jgi:hypothetical protein
MMKTISAALLAVSVLAAPALAATPAKNAIRTHAPAIKTEQVKAKPSVLNANAKMGRHHAHYRHHRPHKHMGVLKTHQKVTVKHVTSAIKRG